MKTLRQFIARLRQESAFGWGLIRWFHREAAQRRVVMLPGGSDLPVWIQTVRYVLWKARNQTIWWRTIPGEAEVTALGDPGLMAEFLEGFDDASLAVIRDTAFYRYFDRLSPDKVWIIHKRGDIPGRRAEFQALLPELKRRYRLPDGFCYTPEVFQYHHGLADAPESVRKYLAGKTFLDAGAYIGDSTLVLLNYAPKCCISFDMSKANRDAYLATMQANNVAQERYRFVAKGIGAGEGRVRFDDTGRSNTTFLLDGSDESDIVSIDEFCAANPEEKIGFVKADIEGFGLQMAHGMLETVRRFRPVLSLAVYHCPDEFFGIKLLLAKNFPDYTFRLVHLHYTRDCEMALLAWPRELDGAEA